MTSPVSESILLIQTKPQRPRVPVDLVPRPRLTEWLDRSSQRPLILVSAPAGYGKSTLISCWLESQETPSAWVSLDEHDDDLAVFLSYFISAIQGLFPDWLAKTQAMLKAPQQP